MFALLHLVCQKIYFYGAFKHLLYCPFCQDTDMYWKIYAASQLLIMTKVKHNENLLLFFHFNKNYLAVTNFCLYPWANILAIEGSTAGSSTGHEHLNECCQWQYENLLIFLTMVIFSYGNNPQHFCYKHQTFLSSIIPLICCHCNSSCSAAFFSSNS